MTAKELYNKTMTASEPTPATKKTTTKTAAILNVVIPAFTKLANVIGEKDKLIAEKDAKIADLVKGAAVYLRHLKAAALVETMVDRGMVPAEDREVKIAEIKAKFDIIPDASQIDSTMKLAESVIPGLGEVLDKTASHSKNLAESSFITFLKS